MNFRLIAPIAVAAVMLISCDGYQKRDNGQSLEEISKLELATALKSATGCWLSSKRFQSVCNR